MEKSQADKAEMTATVNNRILTKLFLAPSYYYQTTRVTVEFFVSVIFLHFLPSLDVNQYDLDKSTAIFSHIFQVKINAHSKCFNYTRFKRLNLISTDICRACK